MGMIREYGIEIGWFDTHIASIARFHEWGTSKLEARSHLYKVFKLPEFQLAMRNIIRSAIINKGSIKAALEEVVSIFIVFYKDFLLSNKITPKLKEATIKAKRLKGSRYPATPLVNTGRMLNLIQYKHTTRSGGSC
ncbi:hypothetical protein [Borrelia sp. P9F1]|uniref:hypothetical protein n=1 Tax=Borrelia sp. P9F1 TaxID=3058374 RepID=UPI0026472132|nr:hypothetical protein [Borrelia sp. P9F1]WKC58453.1 hypothetical protein QYZ68_04560 [Borrelia sp. P9F1]